MTKVVVVTGGTRGIGHGLAKEFLARGCKVAICGRSTEAVETAVASLGGGVVGVAADVTDEAGMRKLWDATVEAFGRVDVWINNAGVSAPRTPFMEIDLDDAWEAVEINLKGVMIGSQVALQGFAKQGRGQLWNMEGFGSGGQKAPGMASYGASKRAVTYFTQALGKDDLGAVQVNLLSPGIVATDLLVRDYDGDPAGLEKAKKIFNILGDKVETVTPWLAAQVLATDKSGAHVQWLTRRKAFGRFATAFRKRDIFA
jgi:NAD(P)-dependent dehydrogenase (short-subunit alcohol dehydrogenase family)